MCDCRDVMRLSGKVSLRDRVKGAVRALSRPRTRRLHPQDAGGGISCGVKLGGGPWRPETGAVSPFCQQTCVRHTSNRKDYREAALTWMGKLLGCTEVASCH